MAEITVSLVLNSKNYEEGIERIHTQLQMLTKNPVQIKFEAAGLDGLSKTALQAAQAQAKATAATENRIRAEKELQQEIEKTRQAQLRLETQQSRERTTRENLFRDKQRELNLEKEITLQKERAATAETNRQKAEIQNSTQTERRLLWEEKRDAEMEDKVDQTSGRLGKVVTAMATAALTKGLKSALTEMKAVDAELINVAKASGAADSEIRQLEQGAYSLAEAFGRTAREVLEAETAFARAGYGEQIEQMAELSLLAQNAGDLTSEQATSFLLATDAAFGYAGNIKQLTAVLDGMNEVSNLNATDMVKMADGMTVAGSVFSSAGESVQTFTAMLGTATAATQRSGSEMARGLRTILMNLRQIKGETDDGELIDGQSIAKAASTLREFAGVETMANGELRKASDVLTELASKWDTLSQVQKSAIAQNVAGQRQANILIALMDNWDMYEKMMVEYTNAAGSAIQENERYLDGWEAKINVLNATWTKFVAKTISSDSIKGLLDLSAGFLNFAGSLENVTLAVGGLVIALKGAKIVKTIQKASLGMAESVLGVAGSLTSFTTIAGIAVAAMGALKTAHDAWRSARASDSKEAAQQADDIIDQQKQITELANEYKQLASDGGIGTDVAKQEQARVIQEQIVDLVGDQKTGLDLVNGSLNEQLRILNQVSYAYTNMSLDDLEAAANTTWNALRKSIDDTFDSIGRMGFGDKQLSEYVKNLQYITQFNSSGGTYFKAKKVDSLEEASALYREMKDLRNFMQENGMEEYGFYDDLNDKLAEYGSLVENAVDTREKYLQQQIKLNALARGELSEKTIDDAAWKLQVDENASVFETELIQNAAADLKEYALAAQAASAASSGVVSSADGETSSIQNLNEQIAKHQQLLTLLKKAQMEENTTGEITQGILDELVAAGADLGTVFYDDVTQGYKLADGTLQKLTEDTREWLDDYDSIADVNEQMQAYRNQLSALRSAQAELNATGEISMATMQKLSSLGLDVGNVYYNEVTNGFTLAKDTLSGMADDVQKSLDAFGQLTNVNEQINQHITQLNLLKKAQAEENRLGVITAETYTEITKAGIDLGDVYHDNVSNGFKTSKGAIEENIDALNEWLESLGKVDAAGNPLDAWALGIDRAEASLKRFKQEVQAMGERGETMDEYKEAYSSAKTRYKDKQYGSREYQGFLELFFTDAKKDSMSGPEAWGKEAFTGFYRGMMEAADTIDMADYLYKNFEDKFGDVSKSGAKFIKNRDGSISMIVDDMNRLVETTGIAEDVWVALKDAMDLYSTERIKDENEQVAVSFDDIAKASKDAAGQIDVTEFVRQSREAGKSAEEISEQLSTMAENPNIKMSMEIDADNAKDTVSQIIADQEKAGQEETKITVDDSEVVNATASANALAEAVNSIPRSVNIKVNLVGAKNLTASVFRGSFFAEGTSNAPGGEALVNELGPELISQDGKAFIANGGEPTIVKLKPGAVVLNHIQTQKALGSTDGFGEINAYKDGTSAITRFLKGLVGTVPGSTKGKGNGSKASAASNTASSAKEDDPWRIVQDYYNRSKDLTEREKDHLNYLIDQFQNEWDDLKEPLDDQIDALNRLNDQLDRQSTLLERERDQLTKPLQEQIDAMNAAKDLQDEQLELAEKQKAVEEARNELQNAQNERTIRYFNTQKGQWEWMADKGRVQDAQDALSSAEKDLADYEYELQIRALEKQVESIEGDYQKKLDELEAQQTANEDRIYDLEQELQGLEDYYQAQMKPLEKQIEAMERKLADYEELWAQIAITQDLPEGNLEWAIGKLTGLTDEQRKSIKEIIEGIKEIPNETASGSAHSLGEITSSIQPGNEQWEAGLNQIGATVDGKNWNVYSDGTTVYNTVTNNDSHNVSYTIGSITVQGDPRTMTVFDLLESTGIYAGD